MPKSLRNIWSQRQIIGELAKNDFRSKYVGSYFGVLWAFIHPLMTVLVLWFVFQAGFKVATVNDIPFVLWLCCGLLPWYFVSEALSGATNSIVEHSYLVKKVVFNVRVLPIVKILSSLLVHLVFTLIVIILFMMFGYFPDLHVLQLPYYLGLAILMLLGITWATAALFVFYRDIGQLIAVVIQFGFWLTPIFWSIDIIPEKYHFLVQLNPAFYIIEGYRDSLINGVWFWEKPQLSLYFGLLALTLFFVGGIVFTRLRPHFADVL